MNKIHTGIAIILFFTLCKSCVSDYIKGGDNKVISNYEKMIHDNSFTTANLESEYKEVTIKVARIPIKSYEFRYKFTVENNEYSGNVTFDELPKSYSVKVFYLKEDPNFNCVDPQNLLTTEKGKNYSKKDLYWGIAWGVLGLLSLLGFINEFRKKKNPN